MTHRKILTIDQLEAIVGPRPRAQKVILAHGVFDLVHPGHLRHLQFAREKADVLVASVTADEFVTKGHLHQNRPYVPQELRAENLAALEIVDYVVIDHHPTPLTLLTHLQPDFLAKGFEYFREGVPIRTQEEMDMLASYGGEMIFTPGDVVYSSSSYLELQEPDLAREKLEVLMSSEGISFADLDRALAQFSGMTVHVIGDTIVDRYSTCSILGTSPKSPTVSVKHESTENFVGGAAVVAKHLASAGAKVTLSTVLGQDAEAALVMADLEAAGVDGLVQSDHTRPTTVKERFVAGSYRLLQVDRVDNRPVSDLVLGGLTTSIKQTTTDIVVFSDFRHGIFNRESISHLTSAIPKKALRVADSQVSNRWGNILDFVGFDLITPNEKEARFALGDQDSVIRPLASHLFHQAACQYLLLKLGSRGVLGYRSPGPEPREFFSIDSFSQSAVDPIGAGDALLAYTSLGLAVSGNIVLAAILGSFAAAVACDVEGNIPVGVAQVQNRIRG